MSIIIPSLEPDQKVIKLVKEINQYQLHSENKQSVIVINDGSDSTYDPIFDELKNLGCIVLKHAINLGKGRALKTAFNYYLNNFPNGLGVVTADADGQHSVEDIFKCWQALENKPEQLILGVRDFSDSAIPLRSRFGNKTTHYVFKALCGINVSDTQTGLRAIPYKYMQKILSMPGERFEYEMNMLIESKTLGTSIHEVPIETIYIEDNRSSHFNPIKDSLRIYALFFKFILSSLASFVVDLGLFTIFFSIFKHTISESILLATILARICSSILNFESNRKIVFKSSTRNHKVQIKYFSLVIVQMFASAYLVKSLFSVSSINPSFLKAIVDFLLFILSFQIQQHFIFNNIKVEANKGNN